MLQWKKHLRTQKPNFWNYTTTTRPDRTRLPQFIRLDKGNRQIRVVTRYHALAGGKLAIAVYGQW